MFFFRQQMNYQMTSDYPPYKMWFQADRTEIWRYIIFLQEEGMTEAEIQETLREKVRTLESYMVDIAQTVIKDSEQSSSDVDGKTPSAFR